MIWRLLGALLGAGVIGCGSTPPFVCSTDVECGDGGRCEANGFCSFSDPKCASGRRFGSLSGDLAGTCVDVPGTSGVADSGGASASGKDDGGASATGANGSTDGGGVSTTAAVTTSAADGTTTEGPATTASSDGVLDTFGPTTSGTTSGSGGSTSGSSTTDASASGTTGASAGGSTGATTSGSSSTTTGAGGSSSSGGTAVNPYGPCDTDADCLEGATCAAVLPSSGLQCINPCSVTMPCPAYQDFMATCYMGACIVACGMGGSCPDGLMCSGMYGACLAP